MIRMAQLALSIAVLAAPSAATAQMISGTAIAKDGDSLTIGAHEVRLFGIDAPEFTQTCNRGGETWNCGEVAKAQLAALIEGKRIECQGVAVDTYGRTVATCTAGYDDINRTMVEQGWAVAYRQFSDAYLAAEQRARAGRLGIWDSEFALPSDYRTAQQSITSAPQRHPSRPHWRAEAAPPQGCVIKGNRNRKGQWIYHLPGMPYYDVTRPEEIFCTEAEAQAAGYRRAIVRP